MATEYIEHGDTVTIPDNTSEGDAPMMPEMPTEEVPEEAAPEAPADMPSEAMPDAE